MQIELLLFSHLREICGVARAGVEVPDDTNVAQIVDAFLAARGIPRAGLPPLRFAVNETFVTADHAPREGDRVAVLTPFAGG